MSVDIATVKRVAHLARIAVSEEDAARMAGELNTILGFVEQLNERIPYYRERHTIKPGITGWAQLCYPYGSSELDATEKLQYDLFYVKNHSLLFYLAILVQTVEVIVWRKGAR